jgi:hypothetical protein
MQSKYGYISQRTQVGLSICLHYNLHKVRNDPDGWILAKFDINYEYVYRTLLKMHIFHSNLKNAM